ncbi:hypothetical protein HA402_008966 [Bradysia odoriphaga]|nr:hypothetical protein HA402_008966 [Bradysia odoriphaga]
MDVEENGKQFIEGAGKSIFQKSKSIQKSALKTGNINRWDLPLIIDAIKCLEMYASAGKRFIVADEHKNLDNLKSIRNQLSHQPTTEVTEENFRKYWDATSQILLSFGVSQATLDEAKNLKFTELTDDLTATSESNAAIADEYKEAGNKYYAAKKYQDAIDKYTEAMQLPGIPLKTLSMLHSNRSLMHLELNELSHAKDDANAAILLNPTWWRGYARLASAYEKSKKYEKAIKNYEIALQTNAPEIHNRTLTDSLCHCRVILGRINRMESIQPHNFINTWNEAVEESNKILGKNPFDEDGANINASMILNNENASNPEVLCAQGHLFLRGIGCAQDFEQAANRFGKAASKGSANGMYNLGVLLLEGKGIKRNAQRGIDMLRQAAAQPSFIVEDNKKLKNEGVSEAKHALGLSYYEGTGVSKNIKTAVLWWERAFREDGNGTSANNLGCMYEDGESVSRDIETAILYWKFAAFDDLTRAMENLYRVFMQSRKYSEAVDWYKLSIEKGSARDNAMEEFIRKRTRQLGNFNSKMFIEKLKAGLRASRFGNIVRQCEELEDNLVRKVNTERKTAAEQIVQRVPKTDSAFIIDHRKYFKETRDICSQSGLVYIVHPSKLKVKPTVNIIGLKSIYFKDMIATAEKIYDGFAIKVLIIDDAIVGQPSVNVIGRDDHGTIHRIFIYNIPQDEETQDKVGYGCTITIVNPYHKIGATDGRPMIRVDDPSTVIYHTMLTNKKRCRYCGDPQGVILCGKCKRVFYCSQVCRSADANENQHHLVCVKKL